MPAPRASDRYESYSNQLVYFEARLAADPKTEHLAPKAGAILEGLDATVAADVAAKRAEVRARAKRDYVDQQGDDEARDWRRRVGGLVPQQHFLQKELFREGIEKTVSPRGRPQLGRLKELSDGIDKMLASPKVAAEPKADELIELLNGGKELMTELRGALETAVVAWEEKVLSAAQTTDMYNFYRSEGVAQVGMLLGELRALLGGSLKAAHAYTMPARSKADVIDDDGED